MFRLAWAAGKALWPEVRLLLLRAAVALDASGLGLAPRPEQLWKAYGIVLPIGLLTWWAIPQFTLVMSPSIEAWAVRADPGPIRRGDLVSFRLSDPIAGPKTVFVTKYALCMPGQMLNEVERPSRRARGMSDGYYYCDGRLLGVSKPTGRKGERLNHLVWGRKPVPIGMVYVGSGHPDGYDSRYYGPVALDRLTRMERVL
ncbi:S26 family signal peptidase [Sphingomonas oryzagri]